MIALGGVHSCFLSWGSCLHSGGAILRCELFLRLTVASGTLDLFHKKPYSVEVGFLESKVTGREGDSEGKCERGKRKIYRGQLSSLNC